MSQQVKFDCGVIDNGLNDKMVVENCYRNVIISDDDDDNVEVLLGDTVNVHRINVHNDINKEEMNVYMVMKSCRDDEVVVDDDSRIVFKDEVVGVSYCIVANVHTVAPTVSYMHRCSSTSAQWNWGNLNMHRDAFKDFGADNVVIASCLVEDMIGEKDSRLIVWRDGDDNVLRCRFDNVELLI